VCSVIRFGRAGLSRQSQERGRDTIRRVREGPILRKIEKGNVDGRSGSGARGGRLLARLFNLELGWRKRSQRGGGDEHVNTRHDRRGGLGER